MPRDGPLGPFKIFYQKHICSFKILFKLADL